MAHLPDWADIASFVALYMDRRRARAGSAAEIAKFNGDLLEEITEAYMAERGLPEAAKVDVLAMVDSVL